MLLARSADEAMEVLDTETIDLLLTDMIMPGLSGKELGSLARSLVPGLGIVYMSGYTDEIIAKHGPFSEDEILVQKPFSPDELLLKLRQALNDGRATPNLIES